MRAVAAGAVLAGELDAAADAGVEGGGEAGRLEAGAALLDVPAGVGLDEDATGADVDVLACLELEVHAVANAASATNAAARTYLRDDVSTDLLSFARSTMRRLASALGCACPAKH
jgi:hypothetical protein